MQLQCHLCGSYSPLHALPNDPVIAEKWKEAIPDATPDVFTANFRLCVLHFDKSYVFQKRHIMKWAVPELIHFNGKSWQKERCDYSPEVPVTKSTKTAAANVPPAVVIQPAPSNVDESPVILPLPPRRDDEPDSDPLAVSEPVVKTPIITHVTSLRHVAEGKQNPLSRFKPSSRHEGETVIPQHSQRLADSSDFPKYIPLTEGMPPSDNMKKPKISVKSPAELSAPNSLEANTIRSRLETRINKPAISNATGGTLLSKLPSSSQKPIIVSPPNQPQYQFIVPPNAVDQKFILAKSASATQYIVTSNNAQNQTIVVSEKNQGQPILFTDTGYKQPLVVREPVNGPPGHPVFFKNQSILLTTVSPQHAITQPPNANLVISDARSLHPDTSRLLSSKSPVQLKAPLMNLIPSAKVSQFAVKSPNEPNPHDSEILAESNAESAEYTEKLTRQAIATVKADIAKTQKKSQALQKKIDLLKLKVSTYEGLISKLVRSNIISQESANECRVLAKDVNRFKNKRKLTEEKREITIKKVREVIENNKENSNDTVDSLDSSAAKDHDYL